MIHQLATLDRILQRQLVCPLMNQVSTYVFHMSKVRKHGDQPVCNDTNVILFFLGPIPAVESPCLRQQSSASSWIKQEPPSPLNISEITWQESLLSPPSDPTDVPPGHWDFVDPTRKLPCSCSKYVIFISRCFVCVCVIFTHVLH